MNTSSRYPRIISSVLLGLLIALFSSYAGQPKSRTAYAHTVDTLFTALPDSIISCLQGTVAWGDYDNDGSLDLFIHGNSTPGGDVNFAMIYHNSGGHFVTIPQVLAGTHSNNGSGRWVDVDNDGRLDLYIEGSTGPANQNPLVKLYHNNGGGSFTDVATSIGPAVGSAAWGDYNNDNAPDLLAAGSATGSTPLSTKIYRNHDNGLFTALPASIAGVWAASVAWGDYDNDGLQDVLVAGLVDNYNGGTTKLYHNNGDGTFTDIHADLVPVWGASVAWGDYDNDGRLDLAISGIESDVIPQKAVTRIYHNDGNGIFTDIHASVPNISTGTVLWGDYDSDGQLDLIVSGTMDANGDSLVTKLFHNENGNFVEVPTSLPSLWFNSLAWGDYDNDGYLDLAVMGSDTTYSIVYTGLTDRIYHNNLGTTPHAVNTPPTPPEGLIAIVGGNSVQFHWDRATDVETPQMGLTYNLRIGTTPGGVDIMSPMADVQSGFRKIPAMGNVCEDTSWTIEKLRPGKYYWSVQAVDNEFAGSPFGLEQTFIIRDSLPLVASTNRLDFGAVLTGESASDTLVLMNSSFTDTIHVDTVSLAGSTEFSVDTIPFSLLPRESRPVIVAFQPTATGGASAVLRYIATNVQNPTLTITLVGKGYQLGDAPVINRIYDVPGDNGYQVRAVWFASTNDTAEAPDRANDYSIWRRVDDPQTSAPILQLKKGTSEILSNGHRYRVMNDQLWDFVADAPAILMHEYATVVPTLYNAVPPSITWSVFMIAARTAEGNVYFSDPDSGFSVDNLGPGAPMAIAATALGKFNLLTWDREATRDVQSYRVYRSIQSTFVPSPGFLVGETPDTSFLDTKGIVIGLKYYYGVTAVDRSGNEGALSQLTSVTNVTDVRDKYSLIPNNFELKQNYPNPFNPMTTIRFGLPKESHVRLSVYDVLGQEVARLVDGDLAPGFHDASWRPAGGSGIYLYRIDAAVKGEGGKGFTKTGKMVFIK